MAGYKKPGPKSKAKKARKKVASLSTMKIARGHAARMRRAILPI